MNNWPVLFKILYAFGFVATTFLFYLAGYSIGYKDAIRFALDKLEEFKKRKEE